MSKFGVYWCFVAGVALAAFVVGFPITFSGDGWGGVYIAVGINVCWLSAVTGYGLLAARQARTERKALSGTEVLRTALAKVETSQATGEAPTLSIRMGLTIAADNAPAFRADTTATVNLMDVDAYKVGKLLVVTYDETNPWRVAVVTDPTPEWAHRMAHDAIDSAPWEAWVEEPPAVVAERSRWGHVGTMSVLVGFVVGLVAFISTHRW